MRAYEVMFILHPTLDTDAADQAARRYAETIMRSGGAVDAIEPWGKRRLAYEIQHHREGIYYVMRFRGEIDVPAELRRVLGLADTVLRYLVVRTDEPDVETPGEQDEEETAEAGEAVSEETDTAGVAQVGQA